MSESKQLKKKATAGVVWVSLQKLSTTVLTFISEIVLARLLMPYDFGCIEMLAIFMLLAEAIVSGGFGAALIQKKRPTQVDYSTIFFWNMGMAAVMYVVLFVSAPAISRFYSIPLLSSVLRVQGLVLFVYAFKIIQVNQLKKQLRFKILAIVNVLSSIVSLIGTIILAYKGFGVWALVARNLMLGILTSTIYWFYVKWRPSLVFSWRSFKELFSFGFYMFLSHIVTIFSSKLQGLLIGRVFNPSTMGYYSKASGTEGIASSTISQIMDQVTYPLYAEVQDNKATMQAMVRRLSMTLSYVTFPVLFLLLLVAKPMFVLLYSEKWLPSVPYFQVLCIGGIAQCLQSVNFQTISAIGKSKVTFVWTMIKRGMGICFIVGGLAFWGMRGILCGAVLNAWFAYFVNMGLVSKHIGYRWYKQLWDLFPVFVASALSAVVSYGVASLLHWEMYPDGAIKILVYVILYMGWSFIMKPEAYLYSKSLIIPILSRIFNSLRRQPA